VIVAVRAVRVMKVTAHEIVDVIAVGQRFVPAALAMTVGLVMIGAGVTRRARRGIRASGSQHMLVDVVAMDAVQVSVVDVIGVIVVLDGLVPTVRRMGVAVARMLLVVAHRVPPRARGDLESTVPLEGFEIRVSSGARRLERCKDYLRTLTGG
jgi:hypothetical protein